MKKQRKESNCKSKRLTGRIIELYNTTELATVEIARVVQLTSVTVKKVAKENGIDKERYDKRPKSVWLDEERNNKIVEALKNGEKYAEIGRRFGISKQRVRQFADQNGINRWKDNREKYEQLVKDVNRDFNAGMSYEEIIDKYDLTNESIKNKLEYYGLESLPKRFRDIRNYEITRQYRQVSAKKVIKSQNPVLNDPTRIGTIRSVYEISSKSGFKKYPNIERGVKGIFVDEKVLKIIKARKNSKYKYTNQMIADELNEKGFRTAYGREFLWHTVQNIWGKYQKQGARKSKIKYNK